MRGTVTGHRRGRRAAIAALMATSALALGTPARAEQVSRDPSFAGGGGVFTVDWDNAIDQPVDVVVQPDGKIVVAGWAHVAGDDDIEVLRFNADGSVDETFGTSGEYFYDNGSSERPNAIALQADGKILVATNAGLIRLNADGTEDTAFGNDGMLAVNSISVYDVLPQADGSFVVVASVASGGDRAVDILIARYTSAGNLDTTFGTNGQTAFDSGGYNWYDSPRQVVQLSDGAFLVAGNRSTASFSGNPPSYTMAVRFTASGHVDTAFNSTGWVAFDFVDSQISAEEGRFAVADADGAAVLGAYLYHDGGALVRLLPDGSLDPGFGDEGVVFDPIELLALTRDNAGRLLAAGFGSSAEVKRFDSSGAVDTTFAQGGYESDVGPYNEAPSALAVQPDGRIVHVGMSWTDLSDSTAYDADWYIERVQLSPDPPPPPPPPPAGYWMLRSDGVVYNFGNAAHLGDPRGKVAGGRAVAIASAPDGGGYWVIDAVGHVFAFGSARYLGGAPGLPAGEEVTSISATKSGNGYWLFTNKGRAFVFGDAVFHGDMSGRALNGPVLGSVRTASGGGYYMVASDGGIFSFGDAVFHGSMGGTRLNGPVVGMAPDPDNEGYWLVGTDGGIFSFKAPFKGSMGSVRLNKPVIGMVAYGDGYLMVGQDGGIFNFSTKPFVGSLGSNPPPLPIIAVAPYPL